MGGQKMCFEAPKIKKMIFTQNPNSVIFLNMGDGQGSGPSHPDSVGSLGLIRGLKILCTIKIELTKTNFTFYLLPTLIIVSGNSIALK